ncbi:hypothetical protein BKA67DRAFT_53603 [Truncatella angustata]|uniref:Nephrocystin 3-like N-terminal domain-containing protein n=1 Tax=Truncatella angustata TaxID=152316 RepID=A0A9P9A3I3_9PEZI|nr:uncharacterized protein BKA67DRAFT_53603 [Truncatella angustata]KAH6660497.1 hypothetical protein BKA67DRAFT_53603 [Truncatella angustata]
MAIRIASSHKSSHVYEDVFDVLLQSEQYRLWKRDDIKWQLRCVGGPGSGKTTFSSQVVQDLKTDFRDSNTIVVSVFLQPSHTTCSVDNAVSFTELLLGEVERQLGLALNIGCGSRKSLNAGSLVAPRFSCPETLHCGDLHRAIASHINLSDRTFLIIDDLDVIWPNLDGYFEIERELTYLKGLGMKILTTSRVLIKGDEDLGECDVDLSRKPLDYWWECVACAGVKDYYICNNCKEAGERCHEPAHTAIEFFQPQIVHLDIGNLPLPGFLKYFLEEDHGELGLRSHLKVPVQQGILPPLSNLGRELISPVNEHSAENLVKELAKQANGNIGLALLRLEHISEAESLEKARAIADRIPRPIVELFNAGMLGIASKPAGIYRDLGLQAIKAVGESAGGLSFTGLKERLLTNWQGDTQALEVLLESELGMEEILLASHGFLVPQESKIPSLDCYHSNFHYYIAEHYAQNFDG